MATSNPFRPTRFEHADQPLIWLSPKVALFERLKSIYVAGARGSGKTSLLKALNWRERLFNETLRSQISSLQPQSYIAIYFRLPDYLTGAFSRVDWCKWYPHAQDIVSIELEIFSALLEFVSAQLLCEAIIELRSSGHFAYSPKDESIFVNSVLTENSEIPFEIERGSGIEDLARSFQRLGRALNHAITRGHVDRIDRLVPKSRPGSLLSEFALSARRLIRSADKASLAANFHFKICIDDCEALTLSQQLCLNTLVRRSSNPLFWIVSFVSSDYDSTSTVINNQSLTDADRVQIDLNEFKEADFISLCEEVSSLRLYYSIPSIRVKSRFDDLGEPLFDLSSVFGIIDQNQLIADSMKDTLSPQYKVLLEEALRNETIVGRRTSGGLPPIWQTYVLKRLKEASQRLAPKKNLDAYLRRKQRAALLNFCAEYRVSNIPYAGANTVVAMSDLCVRDYLEIAASVYDLAMDRGEIASIDGLIGRRAPLSLSLQRQGIQAASKAKFDGIRTNLEGDWVEVSTVVECLGRLVARMQSDYKRIESLATPERGIFAFDLDTREDTVGRDAEVARILGRCLSDGLLRIDASRRVKGVGSTDLTLRGSPILTLRLHRRFAAYFGFSPRGPYEVVRMPMDEFRELCENPRTINPNQWVERVYGRIMSDVPEQPGFDLR